MARERAEKSQRMKELAQMHPEIQEMAPPPQAASHYLWKPMILTSSGPERDNTKSLKYAVFWTVLERDVPGHAAGLRSHRPRSD